MSLPRISRLSLALLLWCATAMAVTPDDLREVRKQFNGGLSSETSNRDIYGRLQQLLQQEPDNPLLLVYYGSTETIMGKYAWMPWSKLGYVNDGIAHIDRALRLAGQQNDTSLNEVQLVAASTYIALPDRFNTFDSGKTLLAQLLALEAASKWSGDFRHSLYVAAAKVAEHDGDREAQTQWQTRAKVFAGDNITGVQQP